MTNQDEDPMTDSKPSEMVERVKPSPPLESRKGEVMSETDQGSSQGTSLPVSGAVGWQPIATAPKDGTAVLLWYKGSQYVAASFNESSWWPMWVSACAGFGDIGNFTHWTPLPSPPRAAQDTSEGATGPGMTQTAQPTSAKPLPDPFSSRSRPSRTAKNCRPRGWRSLLQRGRIQE